VALITAMSPVAQRVGASRIVTGGRIPHPSSDPTRPPEAERAFRRNLMRVALMALKTPVTEPTIFAFNDA
jgi:glycine/betaine/sarcosine/D-proline reductase family selenoprotein B